MTFAPAIRRLTYTTHITSSLAWVGAVIVFIGLAVIGLTSGNEATTRGAYLVMAPAAWFALVPLAHVSLLSGLALCLGTAWGRLSTLLGRVEARDDRVRDGDSPGLHVDVPGDGRDRRGQSGEPG